MKKIVLLLSVVALAFTSCSKNEDTSVLNPTSNPSSNTNGVLPLKIITSSGTNIMDTSEYIYNGNKLSQIKHSDVDYTNYTYTNDLITKSEKYTNNITTGSINYSYNSANKLVQMINLIPSINKGFKDIFTYNADGTVSQSKYSGDLITQTTNTENYKVFFQNGVVIKRERYLNSNGAMQTITTNYVYDSKNYIFNSVLGYNKLTFYDVSYLGAPNNIISFSYSQSNSTTVSQSFSAYTYNTNNYPITKTDTDSSGGPTIVSQIFYQ